MGWMLSSDVDDIRSTDIRDECNPISTNKWRTITSLSHGTKLGYNNILKYIAS